MKERVFQIETEEQMLELGRRIGALASPGMFFALYGNLGAGKSVLARGVARHFGIETLISPTYTIVSEYPTEPRLFHFDAYRLADEDALYAIGYTDYRNENGVILMEWADLVPGCLPKERMDLQIFGCGQTSRTVRLTAHGAAYETILERI